MAGIALGQGSGWGKGHCQAAPGLLFQRWHTGQPGLCPSHCRSPLYVPASTSRVVRCGQKKRERQRPAHPSTKAALACYGQGLKCIETKAESEDLREEGTVGEPWPAPSRGIAPKKGHLSCKEKERRNKREKEKEKGGQWEAQTNIHRTRVELAGLPSIRLQAVAWPLLRVQQRPKVVLWG